MKVVFLIIAIAVVTSSKAQSKNVKKDIQTGERCPFFLLKNISYYQKKTASIDYFKGKWLILDFWNRYCTNCINSMPKMNALSEKFKDEVQIIFVGYNGSELSKSSDDKVIRRLYERVREKYQLILTVAFDSNVYKAFNVIGVPYLVIVDPDGIIRGITYSINENIIRRLLDGTLKELPDARKEKPYDRNLPLLTYENGGADTSYLYRSIISQWNLSIPDVTPSRIDYSGARKFEAFRQRVENLYVFAYTGNYEIKRDDSVDHQMMYPFLIVDTKDSASFKPDYETGKNLYCYSLTVSPVKATRKFLMQVMQTDLKNYFGYDVAFETRKMPYWSVAAIEEAKRKLFTKGGNPEQSTSSHAGFTFINSSPNSLISFLSSYNPSEPPFIDETGIKTNIDITVDALLTDFDDFKRGLEANGLYLVKKEKEMKVLVIRDPKPETE